MIDDGALRAYERANRRIGVAEANESPEIYLPWTQRTLNPFPLASSGGVWGDMDQPWGVRVLAFYCTVFVLTTNNATNFWTVQLIDATSNVLASFTTAAIAANTYSRFAPTVSAQPASSNQALAIKATATLSPGAIYLFPAVALAKTT